MSRLLPIGGRKGLRLQVHRFYHWFSQTQVHYTVLIAAAGQQLWSNHEPFDSSFWRAPEAGITIKKGKSGRVH